MGLIVKCTKLYQARRLHCTACLQSYTYFPPSLSSFQAFSITFIYVMTLFKTYAIARYYVPSSVDINFTVQLLWRSVESHHLSNARIPVCCAMTSRTHLVIECRRAVVIEISTWGSLIIHFKNLYSLNTCSKVVRLSLLENGTGKQKKGYDIVVISRHGGRTSVVRIHSPYAEWLQTTRHHEWNCTQNSDFRHHMASLGHTELKAVS